MPRKQKFPATFAGVTFYGYPLNEDKTEIKVPKDALRKIVTGGNVTITLTNNQQDDTGQNGPLGVRSSDAIIREIRDLGTFQPAVSCLNTKTGVLRFVPCRGVGYDIAQKTDTMTIGVFARGDVPLSVKLSQWLREQKATPVQILDGMVTMLGMVYHAHKDENAALLVVQDGIEAVAKRIAAKK